MSKPVAVIDLFAGMGGFTVGAVNAGATCIVAVDNWNESCAVHRANHPTIPVTRMVLGHPDHWRFFKRMVDDYRSRGYHVHIHGSPPCQALSNASTRSAEEGMPLVLWYLDMVKRCEPDSWSMENVVPVRKKLPEGIPSVVLNSADFGVPQTRRRCYAGEGWAACPSHAKEEWGSVIEALPDLADELRFKTPERLVLPIQRKVGVLKANGRILQPIWREMDEPSQTITGRAESLGKIVVNTAGCGASTSKGGVTRDSSINSPMKTLHNNTPTLRDTTDKPVKIRSLTLPETLILQGFNPDYDLSAARTMKSRWTMVGNAVPPPVAEAVIRGIVNAEAN